ncbi:MAG TPA: hypothetical protein VEO54_05860 [Thermoanaerobaculia bacterium]|nr:hypothetical protein [Thermoanaerobaculia bacterium]
MDASAKLLAIVAIAAFVTERVLAGAAYLMDTVRYLRLRRGAGVRIRAKAQRKLVLLALAGAIAYVVVDRADLRILRLLDVGTVHPLADFWLTWLAVFAGADRVRDMMNGAGSSPPQGAETPVLRVQVNDGEIRELPRTA